MGHSSTLPFHVRVQVAACLSITALFTVNTTADEICIPHWDNAIGQPGMGQPPHNHDPIVSTMTVAKIQGTTHLYAGGIFTFAGNSVVQNIARWNGQQWQPLGSGMGHPPGAHCTTVWSMVEFDDGSGAGPRLYVGGCFTYAGGVVVNRIARWNGTSWSPVGGGMPDGGPVALAVFDDGTGPALYAGGTFSIAGGVPAVGIAKWNGQGWSAVGGGMGGTHPTIRSLAVYDDGSGPALYAGGPFTYAGGVEVNGIAKWDGNSWSALGSGLNSINGGTALGVFDDGSGEALYVGGSFSHADGVPVNGIAKWDGDKWSPVGGGLVGHPSFGYGVGAFHVFDDGSGPALYVGGLFHGAGVVEARHIAKWNGQQWSSLGQGVSGGTITSVNALAVADFGNGPDLYAGGRFAQADGEPASCVAKWQGCPGEIQVHFDIRPGSCPNPLNRNSQGVLPTAILDSEKLDVFDIDIESIVLRRSDGIGGYVAPLNGPPGPGVTVEDVGTPLDGGEGCDCHDLGPDGIDDLAIKFKIPEIVNEFELNDLLPGQSLELRIEGALLDGRSFYATDCITIVGGDAQDVLTLIRNWGQCKDFTPRYCAADLNKDGFVDGTDLLILLSNLW